MVSYPYALRQQFRFLIELYRYPYSKPARFAFFGTIPSSMPSRSAQGWLFRCMLWFWQQEENLSFKCYCVILDQFKCRPWIPGRWFMPLPVSIISSPPVWALAAIATSIHCGGWCDASVTNWCRCQRKRFAGRVEGRKNDNFRVWSQQRFSSSSFSLPDVTSFPRPVIRYWFHQFNMEYRNGWVSTGGFKATAWMSWIMIVLKANFAALTSMSCNVIIGYFVAAF